MTTETKSKPATRELRAEDAAKTAAVISRQEAHLIYPIYVALAREFSFGDAPCPESGAAAALSVPASARKVLRWLFELDRRIQVHQLRFLLQTTDLPTEERLRMLTGWHLRKGNRTSVDRDKIEFLCTQYFVLCAPAQVLAVPITFAAVAGVLRPVLGSSTGILPEWLEPLEMILRESQQCDTLRELLEGGFLEQGRELKNSAEERFYESAALAAFARFNFLLRRSFIQLMNADLTAVRDALTRLSEQGVTTVDCRRSGLTAEEPLAGLLERCEKWKQPFRTDYTEAKAGEVFGLLLAVRADVEEALARNGRQESSAPAEVLEESGGAIEEVRSDETFAGTEQ
jgi:hypothetical protein